MAGWIDKALEELSRTLSSKNEDYRIDGEFSNFEFAADVADVTTIEVMLTQIGIKLGRLRGQRIEYNNESFEDTFKDLAGYAVITYAYIASRSGDNPSAKDSEVQSSPHTWWVK